MPRRSPVVTTIAALCCSLGCVIALGACGTSVSKVNGSVSTTAAATGASGATTSSSAAPSTTSSDNDNPSASTTTTASGHDDNTSVSADAKPYVDAMVESMTSDKDFPGTEAQARCYAAKAVDVIGVDRFKAKGITPDKLGSDSSQDFSDLNLTTAEGNKIYDALGDCDMDMKKIMYDEMAQGGTLTPEVKACLDHVLTDDNLRKLMVSSMIKGDAATDADPALKSISSGLTGCMFMSMGATSTTTP